MLMAAVTFFAACSSDDESWNSASDVTVGMAKAEMKVNEGKGLFNVPIEVKGETDGNVFVTVEVKEVGENPDLDGIVVKMGQSLSYAADDYRLLWPIPKTEMDSNPNLAGQQNPGY